MFAWIMSFCVPYDVLFKKKNYPKGPCDRPVRTEKHQRLPISG